MRDDCIHETEVVKEALRRIPKEVLDQRIFRIVRAAYLSAKNDVLPKEQWTKLEDVSEKNVFLFYLILFYKICICTCFLFCQDVHYLLPVIKQVEEEIEEKKKWEASTD